MYGMFGQGFYGYGTFAVIFELRPQCMGCLAKILISIWEGIIKKISCERRDFESVDKKSLS